MATHHIKNCYNITRTYTLPIRLTIVNAFPSIMLSPSVQHTYYLKDAHAYYHEGYKTLHIITDDGEITLENLDVKTLRNAMKKRTK